MHALKEYGPTEEYGHAPEDRQNQREVYMRPLGEWEGSEENNAP